MLFLIHDASTCLSFPDDLFCFCESGDSVVSCLMLWGLVLKTGSDLCLVTSCLLDHRWLGLAVWWHPLWDCEGLVSTVSGFSEDHTYALYITGRDWNENPVQTKEFLSRGGELKLLLDLWLSKWWFRGWTFVLKSWFFFCLLCPLFLGCIGWCIISVCWCFLSLVFWFNKCVVFSAMLL